MEKLNSLRPLSNSELKQYNGGGWPVVFAAYGCILAAAYYVGYSDGKEDCKKEVDE